ncbi:MAG: hypothetical protein J2P58_10240 [Acidimicrobiaceae bacterium]|nr:hypothetical protein [Acidimicrobiaceae bacterium]MBO0746862.1 hypothetical protein [Acidimicrobiaceae bacterium]
MSTEALERLLQKAASRRREGSAEPCALCAARLDDEHPHLLDLDAGHPLCVCRACSLLFDRPVAAGGRYRLIGDRRLPVVGVAPAALGAPVGLAFFVVSDHGELTAHYPSPAGATRWEVDAARWEETVSACSALAGLEPEVEALLVNSVAGRSEAWIVPISDCFRLTGIVREHWRGLSGGEAVWPRIEDFFDQLRSDNGQDSHR